ncbi:type II toxin-antitoxin system PemK/MazF family toxin [candidate division KSB1 bacterium]|nr:type II toxin-antitoxin system PemK/MazF family toxin [candidate division KSB1 bacterium]NIR69412.1 type II toxin-antitoxin system PemK/MazF family toxin [candidate division KSB1 bacterium]NIS24210.1 type II toxin-antitoxin system PemK/MazF family toxin [candidate division KSB1 bacterium]NIT71124.1 type II toxin-antitoxin system PemK/MazF family toxin [candidate division KSB1 bacterium]NIU24829.1 type II toxin-antitoxin system PemK/MazF family toxin [candidate division KSB1 bacterium]
MFLARFPQTNFASDKLRPILLLAPLPGDYDDWLICMISSKLHQYVEGIDEIIKSNSSDFEQSGLKAESVIRATRIAVISGELLPGPIGEISPQRLKRIRKNLAGWIKSPEKLKKT